MRTALLRMRACAYAQYVRTVRTHTTHVLRSNYAHATHKLRTAHSHHEVFFLIFKKNCTVVVKKKVSDVGRKLSDTRILMFFCASTTSHHELFFSKLKKNIHGNIFQDFYFSFSYQISRLLKMPEKQISGKKPTRVWTRVLL